MKLQEKIYYCRKKAGLSQEVLAEQLGVSRQAISKWETGDSEPEISKLRLLAATFGVTTDWLLSEDEPEEKNADSNSAAPAPGATWVDSIPGVLGKLLRRYGWIVGAYIAIVGAGFTGIGALGRYLTRQMFSGFFDNPLYGGALHFAANNPVSILGTIIMSIGMIMIISGTVLAVVLKRRNNQ